MAWHPVVRVTRHLEIECVCLGQDLNASARTPGACAARSKKSRALVPTRVSIASEACRTAGTSVHGYAARRGCPGPDHGWEQQEVGQVDGDEMTLGAGRCREQRLSRLGVVGLEEDRKTGDTEGATRKERQSCSLRDKREDPRLSQSFDRWGSCSSLRTSEVFHLP
jgi:hypothetical protein